MPDKHQSPMNPNKVETRLREIAERENKATKGPWEWDGRTQSDDGFIYHPQGSLLSGTLVMLSDTYENDHLDLDFIAHSRQDVPWLLELIKKQREALEHIVKFGEHQCEQMCAEDYIPRGRHAPECPIEYLETARDALNFSPENL